MVDDTPATVALVREVLEREGYQVMAANDGQSGLAAVASESPDLVILDVIMPGMDGFQVLRTLRQRRETAGLPVIMLTSVATHPDVLRGWRQNVSGYLKKPFQVPQLVELVAGVIGGGGTDGASAR